MGAGGLCRRTPAALQLPLLKAPVPWVDRHCTNGQIESLVWGVARRVRGSSPRSRTPLPRLIKDTRETDVRPSPAAIDACLRAGRAYTRWTLHRRPYLYVSAGATKPTLSTPPRARPLTFLRDETAPRRRLHEGPTATGIQRFRVSRYLKGRVNSGHIRRALPRHTVSFARSRSTALETIYAHLDTTSTIADTLADSATAKPKRVERVDRISTSSVTEESKDGSNRITLVIWALETRGNPQERRFDLSHENWSTQSREGAAHSRSFPATRCERLPR